MCAYADGMANIEEPSCCCEVGFCNSLMCVLSVGFASAIAQTILTAAGGGGAAPFVNIVACITCESRKALGHKYSLPINDCCCPCAAHYFCQGCSLYQESVYVKHVLKKDMTCCCYTNCCKQVKPGDFRGSIANRHPNAGNGVVTDQPKA